MDTNEENSKRASSNENNERKSINAMNRFNKILEDYEDAFGELPPIPKGGSYSTIADLMEDALISKQPVSIDDVEEAFKNIKCDLV